MRYKGAGRVMPVALGLGIVLAACALSAAEFKVVDGALNPDEAEAETYTGDQVGKYFGSLKRKPARKMTREPAYQNAPLYCELRLGEGGSNVFCGALTGDKTNVYDTLYLDVNQNGDLTDDGRFEVKESEGGRSINQFYGQSDPMALSVKYASGAERTLRVIVRFGGEVQASKLTGTGVIFYSYYVSDHLEGRMDFGDKKGVLVGLYGRGVNGIRASGSVGCFGNAGVDHVRVDINGDGKLDGEREDFLLGGPVVFDGKIWEIASDNSGSNVSVSPSKLAPARVTIKTAWAEAGPTGGILKLSSGNKGGVYKFDLGKSAESTVVLEGSYSIDSRDCSMTDAAGKKWTCRFEARKPIKEDANAPAALVLGAPIKLQAGISGKRNPGEKIRVTAVVTGVGGEGYCLFTADRGQTVNPHVRITNEKDVVIAEGDMGFG